MENVAYREWAPAGTLVKGLMATFSVIVVFGTLAIVLLMKMSVEDVFGIGLAWAVLAFVLSCFGIIEVFEFRLAPTGSLLSTAFSIRNQFC